MTEGFAKALFVIYRLNIEATELGSNACALTGTTAVATKSRDANTSKDFLIQIN
jgi:hypothetical protein